MYEREKVKPIVVSEFGDMLAPAPVEIPSDDRYSEEEYKASICIHDTCRGFVDRVETSSTHHTLHCRKCGLRLPIPASVRTWAELREHFKCESLTWRGGGA